MPETDLKRVDFEPYFLRWDSCMFYPNPGNPKAHEAIKGYSGDGGVLPVHRHQTCQGLVNATQKYPPRVCPHCLIDTSTETTEEERRADPSAIDLSAIRPAR